MYDSDLSTHIKLPGYVCTGFVLFILPYPSKYVKNKRYVDVVMINMKTDSPFETSFVWFKVVGYLDTRL